MSALEFVDSSVADSYVKLTLDTRVHTFEVIRRTAFSFVENCYLFFDWEDEDHIVVTMTAKHQPVEESVLEGFAGEFSNELLNQALRDQLAKETKGVRELLVGRALFAATAQADVYTDDLAFLDEFDDDFLDDEEIDGDEDFMDDPLGIAVPWEEKYGEGENGEKGEDGAASTDEAAATDAVVEPEPTATSAEVETATATPEQSDDDETKVVEEPEEEDLSFLDDPLGGGPPKAEGDQKSETKE